MPKFYDNRALPASVDKDSGNPFYHIWKAMVSRCENPNDKSFVNYGGRGISVCERWHDLANFTADMGPKPTPQHTLERANNDGNYDPFNCAWATRTVQNRNRRPYKKRLHK